MLLPEARLAFVHIPKTGGTSIELFFTGYDWIAENADDYAVYLRERGEYSPTFGGSLCDGDPDYFARQLRRKHATQAELRREAGAAWSGMRRFTFVRNPWERVLSIHAHGVRDGHGSFEPDFRTWLTQPEPLDHMGMPVFRDWLDDWDELHFVGRFETLADDFARLLGQIGWRGPTALPHERHGGGAVRDLATAYDAATVEVVARRCAAEVARGGYAPPRP